MFCRSTILWVKQQLVERNLKAEHFKLNVTRANSCWTRYVSLNGKFFIRQKKKFFCFDDGWWIFVSFVRKPYFKVYIFWCYRPNHIFPRRVLSIFQYKSSPPFLRWVTSPKASLYSFQVSMKPVVPGDVSSHHFRCRWIIAKMTAWTTFFFSTCLKKYPTWFLSLVYLIFRK